MQQRAPVPRRKEAVHAEALSDGLYREEKVKPLEAYLQEQVCGHGWAGGGGTESTVIDLAGMDGTLVGPLQPPTPPHPTQPTNERTKKVAEGSYDFEGNKMLLKLYLLYPSLANQEKVEMVS